MKAGEEIRRLPNCAHAFHSGGCIDRWLRSHNSCPICKRAALPYLAGGAHGKHRHAHAAPTGAEEEEGRAGAGGAGDSVADSYRRLAGAWAELAGYAHPRSEV